MPLVRRTRATLRSAEFGFFGVVVYTRVQTPRRWGEPFNAGVLVFSTLSSRPLRTSWLIVGMGGLDLLPALGRALECLALPVVPGAGPAGAPSGSGRQPPSGPRGRACCRPVDRPMSSVRTRLPLATRRRHPPVGTGRQDPGDREPPRRTANGSRPRAPWARLTTIPAASGPVKAGSLTSAASCQPPPAGADGTPHNAAPGGCLPVGLLIGRARSSRRRCDSTPGSDRTAAPREPPSWRVEPPPALTAGSGLPSADRRPLACRWRQRWRRDSGGVLVRIGIQASYSGGFQETAAEIRDLEAAGLDLAMVAEVYTFDAVSQLGYLAAVTERVELLSGILPIYSRTPALTAMTAAGLDFVSGGRFTLGLGASGPQVIEGWHGVPYDAPLQRTREIVEICRQVWRRERLAHDGKKYTIPLL